MDIKTTAYYPDELSEEVKQALEDDLKKYGHHNLQWMLNIAPSKRLIEQETEENPSRYDVFLQLMFNVIYELSSKDILPPHNICARETIAKNDEISKEEIATEAVNMLALELLKFCNGLKEHIFNPQKKPKGEKYCPLYDEKGIIITKLDSNKDMPVETQNGMFYFDNLLLDKLSKIGKTGEKAHEKFSKSWKERYSKFLESGCQEMALLFKNWISKEEPWSPPFLTLICKILWSDVVKPKWRKKTSLKTPAIPKKIWSESANKLLSPKNKFFDSGDRIELINSGKIIAYAEVATIDKNLLSLIPAGLKDLSTLTGQKTFRWLVRTGYNNVVHEESDPRLIHTSGGFAGIAERIGCTKKTDVQKVKGILYAMDASRIILPYGFDKVIDGRLLLMEAIKTNRNGHPSEINIILGSMLLPHIVFELDRKDKLLLPIPELPPMIGDHRTFAGQAMFQLYIFEVFSNDSRDLAAKGYTHISNEKFIALAEKAGLLSSMVPAILDRWKQEDGLLESDGKYYTLNKKQYGAELEFLINQGRRREEQSKRAKTPKRKKHKSKKS